MTVGELIEKIQLFGLQKLKRYYSFYNGTVADVNDPEKKGRIKVFCPAVYGQKSPDIWAPRLHRYIGSHLPPAVGTVIKVEFREGDPSHPYWYHSNEDQIISDALPNNFIFRTPGGLEMVYDDSAKTITIQQPEGKFTFSVDDDGISIKNKEGQSLKSSLEAINNGIKALTVNTAFGASTVPLNQATFDQIITDIAKYLK